MTVQVRRNPVARHAARFGQKAFDSRSRVSLLIRRHRHFHAVAGGKNHAFQQAGALLQLIQRAGQGLGLKRQTLPHLDRSGAMIEPGDQQLHAHVLQVTIEHPSTTSAITAAFRPRQPAVAWR